MIKKQPLKPYYLTSYKVVNPYRKRIISTVLCTLLAVILTVFIWSDIWTRLCGLMLIIPSAGAFGWTRPWEYIGEEKTNE